MEYLGKFDEAYQLHHRYGNRAFAEMLLGLGFDLAIETAKGCFLIDEHNKRYLDFLGGYGVANIGHNHPMVKRALLHAIKSDEVFVNQAGLSLKAGLLLKRLSDLTGGVLQRGFLSNSGAEAVEAAIKTARASTKKEVIIVAQQAFHGKTMGSLTATGREKFQAPFKPLVPSFVRIPFNDLEALEEALVAHKGNVAGFLVEPVQGEGGVNIPDDGYLACAGELCKKHRALLILDEVQTGMGRTGKMFAYQHENCQPDIICLAKALGGAMQPIGATLFKNSVYLKAYGNQDTALNHTSTFGGNTFAVTASLATLDVLTACGFENLSPVNNAKEIGQLLFDQLKELQRKYPYAIKDVRGKGLLIGIEFYPPSQEAGDLAEIGIGGCAVMVASRLFSQHQILTAFTMNNPSVLRVEPPLIIEQEHVNRFVAGLEEILQKYNQIEDILLQEKVLESADCD